jgi:predicted amidohydrolase YtcJ
LTLGRERADKTWPFKSLLESAGVLAIGSDCPVVDSNPFLEIYRAVTRLHNDGCPPGGWNPSQKLTLPEILRCYTWGSAYAAGRESELGTLAPGNLADVVVLDRNLFTCDESELIDGKVDVTVMDGDIIYER